MKTKKKILIAGLGSMGMRRLKLLRTLFPDVDICGVDNRKDRLNTASRTYSIKTFNNLSSAIEFIRPDFSFVSTSPLSHSSIINQLLKNGSHVFSEIDLVGEGYEKNTILADKAGLVLFLSSTQMYRREIRHITEFVKNIVDNCFYRYHVGQYLPDWHPWENYTEFFVGDKKTNGCREIFAIELPWIINSFGKVKSLTSVSDKLSRLNIDYPDSYAVTFIHETGAVGQIMVDIVSRKAVRDFELLSEDIYLHWGGTPDSLSVYDPLNRKTEYVRLYDEILSDPRYSDNIVENAYVEEMENFFKVVEGKESPMHTYAENKVILNLIDEIEGL